LLITFLACRLSNLSEQGYIRKELNSHRIGLVHQHGHSFVVLRHQYGCREVELLGMLSTPGYIVNSQTKTLLYLRLIYLHVYFPDGFNSVFPMEKLGPFTPEELQLMLSGEQVPQWTREDIMNYTEPKFGYTRDTPGFQKFVNVLVSMSGDERKVRTFRLFRFVSFHYAPRFI